MRTIPSPGVCHLRADLSLVASAWFTITVLVAVVPGCRPARNPERFEGVESHAQVSKPGSSSPERVKLVLGRSFGTLDGPLSFTSLGPVAVGDDRRLAIVDRGACQVVLVSLETDSLLGRLSRCGDGPGELRQVMGLTVRGDSILAYDMTKRAILWLAGDGTEVRRLPLQMFAGTDAPVGLYGLSSVNDTILAAGLLLAPSVADTTNNDLLALIDSRNGATIRRFLGDAATSRRNADNMIRNVPFCVSRSDSGSYLAAFNTWAFEGVIYRLPDLQETGHFVTDLAWATPLHVERDPPGAIRSGIVYAMVGCTDKGVLFRAHRVDQTEKPVRILGGRVEFRDFGGRLLFARDLAAGDSLLGGMAEAGSGDALFFANSDRTTGYPFVREVKVVPVSPDRDH